MRRALCSVVLLAASVGFGGSVRADAGRWTADAGRSRITLHVFKRGLLSAVAHHHHFVAGSWRATATFDGGSPAAARVELIIAADSLRDRQEALSPKERDKVDRQAAGPDVLDARRYPEIRFVSKPLEIGPGTSVRAGGTVEGMLTGTLSLHGKERLVSVPVSATPEGTAWRARGAVTFKQSDFGIRPYSGFLGTIAVRDEVKLEYDVVLVAAKP
jgi:polyisoprenoid-binding protein YceI